MDKTIEVKVNSNIPKVEFSPDVRSINDLDDAKRYETTEDFGVKLVNQAVTSSNLSSIGDHLQTQSPVRS